MPALQKLDVIKSSYMVVLWVLMGILLPKSQNFFQTCAPGRACGRSFQIIWADTREVGGGMARAAAAHREVWACHYYPGGIMLNRRPD